MENGWPKDVIIYRCDSVGIYNFSINMNIDFP